MITAGSLDGMRRWPRQRLIALIAAFALFGAGLAQAAHFHKNEGLHGTETHLQCLLCLHADRWAGPPELPRHIGPTLTVSAVIVTRKAAAPRAAAAAFYDARGPPLI